MRDGIAEPVSRDQIVMRERDREVLFFPVQLTTSKIGNLTRLIGPQSYPVIYVVANPVRDLLDRKNIRGTSTKLQREHENKTKTKLTKIKEQ